MTFVNFNLKLRTEILRALCFFGNGKIDKRSKLRRAIRYDRNHQTAKGELTVANINRRLTQQEIDIGEGPISKHFLGLTCQVPDELVIRQFLLTRFSGLKLNYALQVALASPDSKIIHPLPKEWQRLFESLGLRVAAHRCTCLFFIKIFLIWGYGVFEIIRHIWFQILFLIRFWLGGAKVQKAPYVFFSGLQPNNVNKPGVEPLFDIISWYLQWEGKNELATTLCHDCFHRSNSFLHGQNTVKFQKNPTPPLEKINQLFQFASWGLASIFQSCLNLAVGNWWYGLLLYQTPKARLMSLSEANSVAKQYLFSNSTMFVRPLWTYEAEAKGASVTLYFYSTNSEPHKTRLGYLNPIHGFKLMNWPEYLVWNKPHEKYVQRSKHSSLGKTRIVGPVWIFDSPKPLPVFTKDVISVFDVSPRRPTQYTCLGLDDQYVSFKTIEMFFDDILKASEEFDADLICKPKREIMNVTSGVFDSRYINKIKKMQAKSQWTIASSDISSQRLIKVSRAVVALPFSSVAHVAKDMGVPSVYYDPIGCIFSDDRASHGIKIICGVDELQNWMAKNI